MVLFGLLPTVMAWRQRERRGTATAATAATTTAAAAAADSGGEDTAAGERHVVMVAGGRPVLLGVGAVAVAVIVNQAISHLGQIAAAVRPMLS